MFVRCWEGQSSAQGGPWTSSVVVVGDGCVRMAGGALHLVFVSLFTLVPALHTTLNVDEINSVHYAIDILHKPVIKDQVSGALVGGDVLLLTASTCIDC